MLKRLLNTTVTGTLKVAFYAGAAVGTLAGTCAGVLLGYGLFRFNHNCQVQSGQETTDEEGFVGIPLKTASELTGKESAVQMTQPMSEEDFVGPRLPKNANESISEEQFVGLRLNELPQQFPTP